MLCCCSFLRADKFLGRLKYIIRDVLHLFQLPAVRKGKRVVRRVGKNQSDLKYTKSVEVCCYMFLDACYALSPSTYEYKSVTFFIRLMNVLLANELKIH